MVEPLAKQFIAHALPETLVADFTHVLDTYEEAVRDRQNGKGVTAAARVSIATAIEEGIAAAKKLDVMGSLHRLPQTREAGGARGACD